MRYVSVLCVVFALILSGCVNDDVILDVKNSDLDKNTELQNLVNETTEPEKVETSAVGLPSFLSKNEGGAVLRDTYNAAIIKTNLGDITVSLYNDDAPNTVENFLYLASRKFYDGVKFHRVIKDFMIQAGDPKSRDDDWADDGLGDPGYKFEDEINTRKLVRGSFAMANAGPDTNGSQFFIVTAEATPWLDGLHTNFGTVVKGMEVVDAIEAVSVNGKSHPLTDVVIKSVELISIAK